MKREYTKDQKNIMGLYAMIGAGSILTFVPYSILPIAGFVSVFVGWIASFAYRFKYRDNDMYQFHMKYLNGTILLSSLVLMICVFFFGSIVYFNGDLGPVNDVMQAAERGVVPTQADIARMQYEFVMTNKDLISMTAIFTLSPYPIYLISRIVKGVRKINS